MFLPGAGSFVDDGNSLSLAEPSENSAASGFDHAWVMDDDIVAACLMTQSGELKRAA